MTVETLIAALRRENDRKSAFGALADEIRSGPAEVARLLCPALDDALETTSDDEQYEACLIHAVTGCGLIDPSVVPPPLLLRAIEQGRGIGAVAVLRAATVVARAGAGAILAPPLATVIECSEMCLERGGEYGSSARVHDIAREFWEELAWCDAPSFIALGAHPALANARAAALVARLLRDVGEAHPRDSFEVLESLQAMEQQRTIGAGSLSELEAALRRVSEICEDLRIAREVLDALGWIRAEPRARDLGEPEHDPFVDEICAAVVTAKGERASDAFERLHDVAQNTPTAAVVNGMIEAAQELGEQSSKEAKELSARVAWELAFVAKSPGPWAAGKLHELLGNADLPSMVALGFLVTLARARPSAVVDTYLPLALDVTAARPTLAAISSLWSVISSDKPELVQDLAREWIDRDEDAQHAESGVQPALESDEIALWVPELRRRAGTVLADAAARA
jgi:hypothetical protein